MSESGEQASNISSESLAECRNFWSAALEQRASRFQITHPLTAAGRSNFSAWKAEISVLENLIAAARTRQNAVAPCSALPSEILSRIFEYVQPAFRQSTSLLSQPTAPPQASRWTAVTRVCKHWRDVAIGHRQLWSTISTESRQPWSLFLQRAGKTALSITAVLARLLSASPSDNEYSQCIAQHLHHVHELRLSSSNARIISSIFSDAAVAPILRTLELIYYDYGQVHPMATSSPFSPMPPGFLESATSLQEITVLGCAFPWQANITNLRTLTFHSPGTHSRQPRDVTATVEILRFLKQNTKLEYLVILHLSARSSGTADSDEIIDLPSLIHLRLSGKFASCLSLWRNVRPHPRATIYITPDEEDVAEESKVLDAFSVLSRHMASPNHPPIIRADIRMGRPSSFMLWTTPSLYDIVDATCKPSEHLIVQLDIPGRMPQNTFKSFYSQLPLHAIEELKLEDILPWPKEEWSSFFVATKSLKMVSFKKLSAGSAASLCSALTPAHIPHSNDINSSQKAAQNHHAPLPHLECLRLVNMDLGHPELTNDLVYISLIQMLTARKAIHSGPQALAIQCCSVLEGHICQLEQVVSKFEWDESCGAYDEEGEEEEELDEFDDVWYGQI